MKDMSSTMEHQRRYSRHYERLLASKRLQTFFGVLLVVVLPAMYRWGFDFWNTSTLAQWNAILGTAAAFTLSLTLINRLCLLPGTRSFTYVIPTVAASYTLLIIICGVLEIEVSRLQVGISFVLAIVFGGAFYYVDSKLTTKRMAVVPFGKAPSLCDHHSKSVYWYAMKEPTLVGFKRIDAVVADLRADLPEEWQRFLADCTIHRIPVYHATQAHEMITGKVLLDHLYANEFGSLTPREDYEVIKRGMDILAALILIPLLAPVMLLTALAIRLDSPGKALFCQPRMGFHCRPFTVYKFRSMYTDMKGTGFTQEGNDPRITRVGRFIRKCRLDELPQLFNVLKGDMSMIGPRPESMSLTEWYEKDVPFFHYRHVVRPGITGWAQVEQGYAAEVEGMIEKLEFDFYYIKNFSFWLDLLIFIRTIKTVLFGDGSR
ncbi:exopolysaccharide biosynthesis polyprenyl glycosylphosphotransferase [Cobetia marina]|uniref:exopolysaccharide biosynthesis polyprenyl glycosylphosphotransferase n=1 Tax=Cobetia marina TaxID=28258 RepID=UPI0011689841|nr:exopolysaccharide biosynthesis polyprenyl glycosylphosphotransferase [Cobetia marina]GED44116.1 glycosyl transferase [Cobetia marina]